MSVYDQNNTTKANRIFISYSSIDRVRTNGLALLLEAMGHQVFHDHRTIRPGRRWKAALQDGLDDADAVMVFWTRHAARSDWVRKEYEYFSAKHGDRLLIPVLGDETPLAELLKARQQADFVPVVNEVLEMKRRMKKEGAGAGQIGQAVRERLGEAGIEVKTSHQKRLLFLFLGFGWLLTLLRYPAAWLRKVGNGVVEKSAQASKGQLAALALVAVGAGGLAYPVAMTAVESELPPEVADLRAENDALRDANIELAERNEDLLESDRMLAGLGAGIAALEERLDGIAGRLQPTACVTPNDFAACRTDIDRASSTLNQRLSAITDLLRQRDSADEIGGAAIASPSDGTDAAGGVGAIDAAGEEAMSAAGDAGEPESAVTVEELAASNECDVPITVEESVKPRYPESALARQIEGPVTVRATINAAGEVTDAVVISGIDDDLDVAAREAMLRWKFSRCLVAGEPRDVSHRVKFKFDMHE